MTLRGVIAAGLMLGLCALFLTTPALAQASRADGESFRDCAECPLMVVVPGGAFRMGEDQDGPRLQVNRMAVSSFEVTHGEYAAFMRLSGRDATAPCEATEGFAGSAGRGAWNDPGFAQPDDHPIVCVSWDDARAYVSWLNSFVEGGGYRLLTDEEWEYAARGGSEDPYPWGDEANRRRANYGDDDNDHNDHNDLRSQGRAEGRDHWVYTSPIGSFDPNNFRLFDVSGNVAEWTSTCFGEAARGTLCSTYTVRGGSWRSPSEGIAVYLRSGQGRETARDDLGFRVARDLN